jgi:hypothetical protein
MLPRWSATKTRLGHRRIRVWWAHSVVGSCTCHSWWVTFRTFHLLQNCLLGGTAV